MKQLVLVVCLTACGSVAAVPDAPPPDVLPDSLTCAADKLACNACIDPLTDVMNCGSCGNACPAVGSTCQAGHCVDTITTCSQIHQLNTAAPNGTYTLLDGSKVYCDMDSGGTSYYQLAIDNFNQTPTGFKLVTLADLQTAATQKAFITVYNLQAGALPVLDSPMDVVNNCAFKVSTTANLTLHLSASLVDPATVGASGPITCLAAPGSYATATLTYALATGPVFAGTTMAVDFFTTHPATETAGGADGNNPGFFWKVVGP